MVYRAGLILVCALGVLSAQIQIPTRGKSSKGKEPAQVLPSFKGKLKRMDEKSIVLELGDYRELEFRRTSKTKFFKEGKEISTSNFTAGDEISVEGPEDIQGFLTAVNVYWEKAATAETSQSKDGAVDTWKEGPGTTKPESSAEKAPPASRPDPDDPGRPRLQRGKPADMARQRAPEIPGESTVTTPTPAPPTPAPTIPAETAKDEDRISRTRGDDPLIRKAADTAMDFTEGLPNYFCQEVISRFQSETRPADWKAIDIVTAAVVYENGREDYRNITLNGKPAKKPMEELGGSWSKGEFGTMLINLFAPGTAAEFHYKKDARIAGLTTKVYSFEVTRENSRWTIRMGSQTFAPAYRGSVWIDPKSARVMRIEMQATSFPDEFPSDHVESATDYEFIRLGDAKQYLLPVHAETLSCQRGSTFCTKNNIDFRQYHKYSGESEITFGEPKR